MPIHRAIPACLAAASVLAACSTAAPGPELRPVTVAFALTANGKPARCGVPLGPLGAGGTPAVLHDARFYVQDVALIDMAGRAVPLALAQNEWQTASTALLDFEDGSGGLCRRHAGDQQHGDGERAGRPLRRALLHRRGSVRPEPWQHGEGDAPAGHRRHGMELAGRPQIHQGGGRSGRRGRQAGRVQGQDLVRPSRLHRLHRQPGGRGKACPARGPTACR